MRYLLHSAVIVVIPLALGVVVWIAGRDQPLPLEPYRPPEVEMMFPVEDIDDLAQGKEYDRLVHLFAPANEPSEKEMAHYSEFRYTGKTPKQFGDKATVMVSVKDEATGKVRGEFKWTMTRVERAWKLVDAPVPK
jgi:hypothetical protein